MRIDRYIFRETSVPFVIVLAMAVGLLVANRLLKVLPWLFEVNVPFAEVATVMLWLVPSFLLYAFPVAAWIAWIVGYGRLGVDGELVALGTVGVPPQRMLRAGLISGAALAAIALVLSQWGYGQGRERFYRGIEELARTAALTSLRSGTLVELPGGLWVGRGEDDEDADGNVFVVREPDLVMTAGAARPTTATTPTLELRDGIAMPRRTTAATVVAFERGRLRLDPGTSRTGGASVRERTLTRLWRDRDDRQAASELHQRLALSMGLLVAPLAAFGIAPRRRRTGRSSALLHALAGIAVYYGLFTAGKQAALKGWLPAAVGIWTADVVVLVWGLWAIHRMRRGPGMP